MKRDGIAAWNGEAFAGTLCKGGTTGELFAWPGSLDGGPADGLELGSAMAGTEGA